MNTCPLVLRRHARGTATLAAVVVLSTVLFVAVTGVLHWASSTTRQAARSVTRTRLLYAAESGLQYAVGKFKLVPRGGFFDYTALSNEFAQIAAATFPPDILLQRYTVAYTSSNAPVLYGKYRGLYQIEAIYTITSRAADARDPDNAVELQLQMGSLFISPFQFGVFYNENLEIHPGADMIISGRVHSNKNIYMWPTRRLTFNDPVTCVGKFIRGDDGWNIFTNALRPTRDQGQIRVATNVASTAFVRLGKRRSDGFEFDSYVSGTTPTEYFDSDHPNWAAQSRTRLRDRVLDGTHGTDTLTLPFEGAEEYTRVLVDPPVHGETANVAVVRMANRAALVIDTDDGLYLQQGPVTNIEFTTRTYLGNAFSGSYAFVTRTNLFLNGRQNYLINPVDFNMARFRQWLQSPACPAAARDEFFHSPNGRAGIIYVNPPEQGPRTPLSTNTAVRIVNGEELPRALTFVTPYPLYTKGNFNTKIGANINTSFPCAVVADCLTPLSTAWNDWQNLTNNYHPAADTILNTAIVVGNSMSTTNVTGGGLHNLPRFLENWSGRTITIRGSMICLFPSEKETAQHVDINPTYYSPPIRNYLYDPRLGRYETSPPGIPNVYRYGVLSWAQTR